ncbi:MAG: hypothetical protein A2831_01560 [Candidatus Yanofskybacteria bacterium RIFCSPHIGHO2_01_FULL_44_17]|uniref:VWFA domain-containing protein n=1 Tax=Candidatus Yanofskybacteria bacterium RIFCSPHIGHO2_01_FULL_44_17 TaxID=1802668 RepID=A0A1F8EX07_9BACT|nr:MAG: hypothetical protein A2831_01560 [Candidatus Yanofskybacteria bacterium RIFCSPHIGHO2_01_FULL_44_17]
MELRNPEYLAGILAFALLLFLLNKSSRRGYYFSGSLAVKKAGIFLRALSATPMLAYLLIAILLLLALAAPFTVQTRTEVVIEGKIIVPCIDVSGSMDEFVADGRTKLIVVKDILKEFSETRSDSDALGLTAFSGGGEGWGAGIIQRPTLSKEVFNVAATKVYSQIFGSNTSIGEGIFISVLAVNEMDWHAGLQKESDNSEIEFNIRRLWAAANSLDLPELGSPSPTAKTQDDFIISEAVRLTPPAKSKNRIIILFSDGDSNTGLDPIKSIWLAERLGIKVYYIEVLTAPSPPEAEEEVVAEDGLWVNHSPVRPPRVIVKLLPAARLIAQAGVGNDYSNVAEAHRPLVAAIKRTGGEYFSSNNYDDVRKFFLEISRLEKDLMTPEVKYDVSESYIFFVMLACGFFLLLVFVEVLINL